jgi:VWFA-related protein
VGLSAALTASQVPAPSQPSTTFRTGVDVVQVDVSVLDKDRRPVRGLAAADFTMTVDGRPVSIAAFAEVDLAARASSAAASSASPAAWVNDVAPDVATSEVARDGRLVVILFDLTLKSVQQVLARKVAARAIDELGPNDLAAVVYVLGGTPQPFTRDRAKLMAAIEKPFASFADGAEWLAGDPTSRSTPVSQSAYRQDPRNGLCVPGPCNLAVLTNIADALRDAPRRKMVLFLTTGPTIQSTGPDAGEVRAARERLFRALDVANLTVYAIDPTGLETLAPNADYITGGRITADRTGIVAANIKRQQDVQVLPARTGGRAVLNANEPQTYMPAIFSESESYYTLAFKPDQPKADGRFHRIGVTVKRNDVSVSARKGYYDGGAPADASARSIEGVPPVVADILTASWPRADLPLAVSVAAFASPDGGRPVLGAVIGSSRSREAPGASSEAEIEIVLAAFDRNGRSANYHRQTLGLTSAPGALYAVLSKLPLDPGPYEIRVAARELATGRAGSVFTSVEVPDFTNMPLSLSGVALEVRPAELVAAEDALRGVVPIVPTARRVLDRSDRATAFLRVYQGGQDALRPVQVSTRIQSAGGKNVFDATRALTNGDFADNRSADYMIELPIDSLEAGEYLLTVEASERTRTERRDLRFSVR